MTEYSLMIVDDDEVDRYSLKRLLRSCGINAEVHEASDGLAAIKYLEKRESDHPQSCLAFPPILVFVDINMPRMNGFEFLDAFSKLRDKNLVLETVVFLMITSSENEDDKEQVAKYEFVKGYITKMPRDSSDLRNMIDAYLPA